MTHMKPILAMISAGAGIALVLLAIHIQRDRFAFTSLAARNFDASTMVTPPYTVAEQPSPFTELRPAIPTIELEELRVLPATPRAQKPQVPPRATDGPNNEPLQPPCNPEWRELESGPAGRFVRGMCPPTASDNLPRS